jgi:predicted polyphosphate/ATP-dependent NAD kinase
MRATVGIIANPASGKDIRRLVAHGSVFDNSEKINIIQRVLRGLDALGIARVFAMPDSFGLAITAYERAGVSLEMTLLDLPVTNTQADSRRAAAAMAAAGAGCIVTLGGDGTNRVVAQGSGYVPILPISTGTNNVFPVMVEGTLAGLAAAVVARNVPGVRRAAVRTARRLDIWRNGEPVDNALVDVVVYGERFVASRAIWDPAKIRSVILAQAEPGRIGGAAVAGYLPEIGKQRGRGVWLELDPAAEAERITVPLAPGLMRDVVIVSRRWLDVGELGRVEHAPAVLALDGEREVIVHPGDRVEIHLTQNGPQVVNVEAALQAASQAGVFLQGNRPPEGGSPPTRSLSLSKADPSTDPPSTDSGDASGAAPSTGSGGGGRLSDANGDLRNAVERPDCEGGDRP